MGMFNYVDHECECPKCGEFVAGFQTKDQSHNELTCITVPVEEVDNFYGDCAACGLWIEFFRIPPVPAFPFRMTTRP